MRFMDSLDSSFGMAFGISGVYGAGWIYGAVYGLDKTMAARAFAISAATIMIFNVSANIISGGEEDNPLSFYAIRLVGGTALAVIHIVVCRQLNLIANLGTEFLAFNATMFALSNLHGLCNKS